MNLTWILNSPQPVAPNLSDQGFAPPELNDLWYPSTSWTEPQPYAYWIYGSAQAFAPSSQHFLEWQIWPAGTLGAIDENALDPIFRQKLDQIFSHLRQGISAQVISATGSKQVRISASDAAGAAAVAEAARSVGLAATVTSTVVDVSLPAQVQFEATTSPGAVDKSASSDGSGVLLVFGVLVLGGILILGRK